MNVLILAAGLSDPDPEQGNYPSLLTEEHGGLLLERLVQSCADLPQALMIFALREEDIRRHHLDKVLQLVSPGAVALRVHGSTAGAACTALLAVDHLDREDELLILNGNEIVDADFAAVTADFRNRGLDAGAIIFPSIHPRYSYLRLDEAELVTEAAEKSPISRNATAGFYWYRKAGDFVSAAESMVRKGDAVGGSFYICPAFNQMVLAQKRVGVHRIAASQYRPVKSRRQREMVEAFESGRLMT